MADTKHTCVPDETYWPAQAYCWREHKDEILACLDAFKPGPFHWPDDALGGKVWHYDFHCGVGDHVGWVKAWNAEGRKTEWVAFIRQWIEANG